MDAATVLKLHDIKKTPGRLAIINALHESSVPLSEPEIREQMKENYDRITFYRNIQTLSSAGIIHRIVVDNTLVHYGLNYCEAGHQHQNEHAHFYCEECQSVECLQDVKIPQFNLPEGYKTVDSDIIIRGKCEKCNH